MLIVGGAGGMGTWFRGFLGLMGHEVDIVDPALGEHARTRRAASASSATSRTWTRYAAVIVSVPLGRTAAALEEVVARRPKAPVSRSPRSSPR